MNNLKYLIVFTVCVFFIYGCSEGTVNNEVKGDLNRVDTPLEITVHVFDNQYALKKATEKYKTTKQVGFTVWTLTDNTCHIYVVKGRKQFETWGHELAHCVYGTFHEE